MSRGRHARKSSGGGKIGLIFILVLFAAAIIYLGFYLFGDDEPIDSNIETSDVSGEESEVSEETSNVSEESSETAEPSDDESKEENSKEESSETSEENSKDESSETKEESSKPESSEDEESSTSTLPQQVDAEYEKWLASAMVMGISMDYVDFEIKGIYSTSATKLADKANSDGVYVVFTADGTEYALYSSPIAEERTEAGTNDISSMTTGFATFDLVDLSAVPTDSLVQYTMDDLQETIAQSMLVSVYYH